MSWLNNSVHTRRDNEADLMTACTMRHAMRTNGGNLTTMRNMALAIFFIIIIFQEFRIFSTTLQRTVLDYPYQRIN